MKRFDLGILADFFLPMAGGNAEVERNYFVGLKNGKIEAVEKWRPALKRD